MDEKFKPSTQGVKIEKKDFKIDLETPTSEEFNGDYEDFLKKAIPQWRSNHKKLLKIVKEGKFPFFGLHGTPSMNMAQILESHKCGIEMATFYKKNKEEDFLYKLYYACIYVSNYAFERGVHHKPILDRSPGGILVFNLENEDKNITNSWENLAYGSTMSTSLTIDSSEESKNFLAMKHLENLPFRTDYEFNEDKFDRCFKGVVRISDLEKYFKPSSISDSSKIARLVIKDRFLAQEILARVLELLMNQK